MDIIQIIVESGALAQIDMPEGFRNIISLLRAFAAILAVAALIYSGVAFATGRVDNALYGIVAAGMLGISVALVKIIFEGTGDGLDF